MTVKFKTVITKAGAEKLAAATVPNGKKVNFTAMAVGDGGGALPVPDASQTKLVNEVWRHALNKISQDKKNKNYVVAELLIPPEVGGFWMREMGLYDDTGTLIAVGNMAESYKPALAEGSGRAQTLRMVIMVSDISSVELTIDTSTVMATQEYVDGKLAEHEQSRRHPDATLTAKGFTQLSSATDSTSEVLAATPKAVKAAYDLANGKYTAADATTARKGIVQLSSATDSVSEVLAATPKAVKAAYDLANGKYTAADATTTQKGLVQLSSATDSTSETLAATSRAVKAANDNANGRVPSGRKINGHPLTNDFDITAQDIFNGQAVGIGNAADLNTYTTPGLYYQPANAQAATGQNYPEANAGSLEVYKHAGFTQIYRIYNSSRSYIRTLYSGVWSAWAKQYDEANKPTAADVSAIPLAGSTAVSGVVRSSAEFQSLSANSYRMVYGNYGTFWRQDGSNLYLMLTNSGDQYGSYNGLRPFAVNLSSGDVTTGKLNLTNFQYFDARYYTKAQSDAGFMAKTGAYTKAESDGRYQPKGSYTPAGQAYTKAESDARYGVGKTTTGNSNAYYTHGNGAVFMQAVRGIAVGNNTAVTVTLPTSFPNGILGTGASYYGSGGNNSDSFYLCTPVGKNQVKIETHNCTGSFSLIVSGY
ncbi:tail protein [Enterobacter cloacae]|uniref:phage tail-collar fiber domain-containing protein n=1 Tax=Enterobacter cloacae TaxID=550 RepID=UPI00062C6585|nr:phage tail protein [Enterobacter cloacae]KKY86988.1 tail protein [Enterobacter cloacae]MDR9932143.1 tail fiber protein [Enterobacter cloacae subsp. dissolvens]HCR2004091.1 phage tail protein [Enterobacter cloacae subsp. dissolvens]HCR2161892.1 phage tail protein [Enterobacter cloacae subsp. dissolvens]